MFNFFKKKRKSKCCLGLDIGSEAVKALVLNQDQRHYTQYYEKYTIFDSKSFELDLIKRALSKAMAGATVESKDFKQITVLLPPTILRSKVGVVSFNRDPSQPITKKERKFIIDKALTEIKKEVASGLGIMPSEFYFKHWEILQIKIDGYQVASLLGVGGREVELHILTTFLLNKYLEQLRIIEEFLKSEIKLVHPAQSLVSHLNQGNLGDGLYLDIGGEITQIFLIKEGELMMAEQFERGGKTFTNCLCRELGLTETRARVLKERYSRGKLSASSKNMINRLLKGEVEVWFEKLKSTVGGYTKILPPHIFLFGGGSKLPDFPIVLEENNWNEFSFFSSPIIKLLRPSDFNFKKAEQLGTQFTPLVLAIKLFLEKKFAPKN